MQLASELYDLNNDLSDSRRKMGRAMKYIAPRKERQLTRLESKPVYSTVDFEQAADSAPSDLRIQRQLGLHYEVNGNWSKAKDVYLRQVARHYSNPDAHFYLGSLYEKLGDYHKARQSYEEALDLDPGHKGTLDAMAVKDKNSPALKMSRQVLVRTASKAPEGPAKKFTLIHEMINENKFDEAISMANQAIESYPDHNGFIYLQAIAYTELGEIDLAKASFQKSIKMDPKHKQSHLGLANLYYNMGKYIYAALSFGDVVYLDSQHFDSRYMQGLSYFNAQEWGLAASVWEDLLHYQSQHPLVRNLLPQTYYILAVEYNRLGEPGLGRTSFEKALSVNSNSYAWLPGAFRTLGRFYQDKAMFKESLSAFQEVLELRPNDSSAYTGMGVTYWKMNEHQLAIAAWNRSLQINPEDNDAKGWLILSKRLGS
jgi:tetratricopeptide (TPR) repeat protein